MRRTEMGKFITPLSKNNTLDKAEAGFIPALPPVPNDILLMVLKFFRYMALNGNFEALVNIYWDKEEKSFIADVPNQKVTEYSVSSEINSNYDDERYIHYMDIHSHNSMRAVFSKIDDADEKAARVYAVIGKVLDFFLEINVRISSSGNFVEIPPQLVFCDVICQEYYPPDWEDKVQIASDEITSAKVEQCFSTKCLSRCATLQILRIRGSTQVCRIFFELMLRYNISVDQFLLETPPEKNTQRRQLDALLDGMSDTGIRIVTATAKEISEVEK